jgi:lysophospholipase L1-like esterase
MHGLPPGRPVHNPEARIRAQLSLTSTIKRCASASASRIRTIGAFDGVIDFDAVVRDPNHPSQLLPKFASKDHLHPNDEGYKAMADSIDLNLFK